MGDSAEDFRLLKDWQKQRRHERLVANQAQILAVVEDPFVTVHQYNEHHWRVSYHHVQGHFWPSTGRASIRGYQSQKGTLLHMVDTLKKLYHEENNR